MTDIEDEQHVEQLAAALRADWRDLGSKVARERFKPVYFTSNKDYKNSAANLHFYHKKQFKGDFQVLGIVGEDAPIDEAVRDLTFDMVLVSYDPKMITTYSSDTGLVHIKPEKTHGYRYAEHLAAAIVDELQHQKGPACRAFEDTQTMHKLWDCWNNNFHEVVQSREVKQVYNNIEAVL